jgi:hypothetical protein
MHLTESISFVLDKANTMLHMPFRVHFSIDFDSSKKLISAQRTGITMHEAIYEKGCINKDMKIFGSYDTHYGNEEPGHGDYRGVPSIAIHCLHVQPITCWTL